MHTQKQRVRMTIQIRAFLVPALVWAPLTLAQETPTFPDTCRCEHCHGEYRWQDKTVKTEPPPSIPDHLKPSEVGAWTGPGGTFHKDTPRVAEELRWYQVTGRVTLVKIEPDGDLHIQLVDEGATDDSVNLVVEVPAGEPWCNIRETVFGWMTSKPPFSTNGRKFHITANPVVTVTGMAFYDATHGQGDSNANRRHVPANATPVTQHVAIWEIHPVMRLTVDSQ
jgi:hypothetical protein